MIKLLDHARLILGPQQREDGRRLVPKHEAIPGFSMRRRPEVAPAPFARNRSVGMYRRSAARVRLRQQCLVVLFCRLERIRADYRRPRVVLVAISPGGGLRITVGEDGAALELY